MKATISLVAQFEGETFKFDLFPVRQKDHHPDTKDVTAIIHTEKQTPLLVVGDGKEWSYSDVCLLVNMLNGVWYMVEDAVVDGDEDPEPEALQYIIEQIITKNKKATFTLKPAR
jgi:hypothetical protein